MSGGPVFVGDRNKRCCRSARVSTCRSTCLNACTSKHIDHKRCCRFVSEAMTTAGSSAVADPSPRCVRVDVCTDVCIDMRHRPLRSRWHHPQHSPALIAPSQHTHTRARMHARTRAHMHARTHARRNARTHEHACTRARACTHTCTHTRMHARVLTHAHAPAHWRIVVAGRFLVWRFGCK